MSLATFIRDLETLPKTLQRESDRIVLDNAADLNREQLSKGKNADGGQITKQIVRAGATDYAPSYKKLKQRKGLQSKFIDANFSGKYTKSITAKKKTKGKFKVEATDPKADEVQKNLGNLEGLNDEADMKLEGLIAAGFTKILRKL